tara:strand:+ start:3002 stop:3445 length:444 start_codon:yes stop_codon:yes gene_type:complete
MFLLDITEASWTTRLCNIDLLSLMQVFAVLFLAILFLQSGLDKVFDWKGNLEWLKDHFAKSILEGMVPFLLCVVTLIELAAGIFSTIGVVNILFGNGDFIAFIGAVLSAIALLMLFFGQRIAKDYAGAGGLVPYFILTLATLYILAI